MIQSLAPALLFIFLRDKISISLWVGETELFFTTLCETNVNTQCSIATLPLNPMLAVVF